MTIAWQLTASSLESRFCRATPANGCGITSMKKNAEPENADRQGAAA
jgi:hypothetical protein